MAAPLVDHAETPWRTGRFDGRAGPARLLFGRTFEDPSIELALMPATGRVLCIASAGDTARALAARRGDVLAVDVNPAQLDEVRRRLGGATPRRGSADRLLAAGRMALVPLGWRPRRLGRFCALDDPVEQVAEWRRLTSTPVRAALAVALAPTSLRAAYGPSFARLAPAGFGGLLLDRIGRRIAHAPNRANPWLTHLLTGSWPSADPRAGGDRIRLVGGDVLDVLEAVPPWSLDGISLSNVLDGPGSVYRRRLLAAARHAARPGAPIIVRSFLEPADDAERRRADRDRSLLWGSIAVFRP